MVSQRRVREMIWDWDPIGVSENRTDIPDEYDGLVSIAQAMLTAHDEPSLVARRLIEELHSNWGVDKVPAGLEERLRDLLI